MDRICKNCRLYNERDRVCGVTVIIAGEHYELPVLPNDDCHWERLDEEIQAELRGELGRQTEAYFKAKLSDELDKPIEVKQVRMWSDGKNGYIEYPTD